MEKERKNKVRVFYFGTFSPIHKGHIEIIKYGLRSLSPDQFDIVISKESPEKKGQVSVNYGDRRAMVEESLREEGLLEKVNICDSERDTIGVNYTIDTITKERKAYPYSEWDFVILLGEDNYEKIDTWKSSNKLKEQCEFLVYPRENIHDDLPLIPISSTMIRNMNREELLETDFICESTKSYIIDNNLYGNYITPNMIEIDALEENLKDKICQTIKKYTTDREIIVDKYYYSSIVANQDSELDSIDCYYVKSVMNGMINISDTHDLLNTEAVDSIEADLPVLLDLYNLIIYS